MLCLKLRNKVVDLTYPDGRTLTLYGPTAWSKQTIRATVPGSEPRDFPQPLGNGRVIVEVGGLRVTLIAVAGRPPSHCCVGFGVSRQVKISRRAS